MLDLMGELLFITEKFEYRNRVGNICFKQFKLSTNETHIGIWLFLNFDETKIHKVTNCSIILSPYRSRLERSGGVSR